MLLSRKIIKHNFKYIKYLTCINILLMELMNNVKEKADMILEPLQVMIELSMLSYCEIGTKLSVDENLLTLHQPSYTQGLIRWWNNDKKQDIDYLFHAIRRYFIWYKTQDHKIFNFILEKAIIGLNKLIETYKKCDERSILQTLSLYKNVLDLDNSDLFKDKSEEAVNMDKVFKNIIDIYDDKMMRVVYNILLLMEENKGSQQVLNSYLTALKHFMIPINQKIRAWIQENLVM